MPDLDYVNFLQVTLREADDARKPLERQWVQAWDLFHNRHDFSQKAGWQSRQPISRFPQAVETVSDALNRSLHMAPEFYVIEGESPEDKDKAPLLKRITDLWLRLANFPVVFSDTTKLAGITDLFPLKLTWPSWEQRELVMEPPPIGDLLGGLGLLAPAAKMRLVQRSGLRIELLDPFRVWIDPSGRRRYVIEKTITDLDELRALAKGAPGAWDVNEIDRLDAKRTEDFETYREAQRRGLASTPTASWRKPVTLTTYWGDVVNDMGKTVGRDQTFTVAEDRFLVGKPRAIPYWHAVLDHQYPNKRGPIIWGSLQRVPLSPYGKGLARDAAGVAVMITELANAIMDETVFASINAFELDIDMLENPEELKGGIYPGKVFTKRGGLGRPLLEPRQLGQVNPQSLAVLNVLDRLFQNATRATDYIAPVQPTRTSPTLGEYQGRQSQALGSLDMIARNIEDQVLEPLLETVYWLWLQYMDDFAAAPVVEALGDDAIRLASMPPEQRFGILKANVRFRARGMSIVLSKSEELQKVAAFLQVLPPLLQAVPGLAQVVNWFALFRKVIEGLHWDANEVLTPPMQTAMPSVMGNGQAMSPMMNPMMEVSGNAAVP